MKRIVLTGATGMIGIALIQLCIENNMEIYALCHEHSKRMAYVPKHPLVHVIECNLDQMNELDVKGKPSCDVFFHLGWDATIGDERNDVNTQIKNIRYTVDAVMLAKRFGCHTFVGAGSQAEYGRFEGKLDANVPAFPDNAYGSAKLCAGQMSRIACEQLEIRHVWARILSVYGPYDSSKTMISTLINRLLDGEVPKLTRGEQMWDYLYCSDAAKALFLLGDKGKNCKVYCIGSGKAVKLIDYINVIREKINPEAELGIGEIPYHHNQVMHLCADIMDLQKDTGFYPEVTFEEGIQKTINWIRMGKQNEKNQHNDTML